jgi:hypothetical protein
VDPTSGTPIPRRGESNVSGDFFADFDVAI